MRHRTKSQPRPRARRLLRVGREVGLTLGALAGVLCMLMAVLAVAFDVQPVVFRSGSMSPAIETGALAISRTVDAADMEVGDIVTVRTSNGIRVTHRIQSITRQGDEATLILRGDANTVPDEESYVVRSADRVLFDVPKAGHVVNAVTGQVGVFAAGLLVGLLMVTAFSRRSRDDDDKEKKVEPTELVPLWDELVDSMPSPPAKRRKDRGGRRALIVLSMLVVGTLTAVITGSTGAYFNDSATVASGTFTMKAAPPAEPVLTCTTSGNQLTLNWTYSPDPSTKFIVRSTGTPTAVPGTPVDVAKILRTWTSAGFNSRNGQIWVVAVEGATEIESAKATYSFGSGNGGGNKSCTSP
jgi:signal peptidase I